MSVFVDTSALLAVMSGDDRAHARVRPVWEALLASAEPLVTSNYVVLELHALIQRRFGMSGVHVLDTVFLPALEIHWITRETHETGAAAVAFANRSDLSLVDCTSFIVMRELALTRAFTLDPHFAEQGFEVV